MLSRRIIFWEVDVQRDFVMPGGKLYVPGAEKLLPNIRQLTGAARNGEVFLVSDACVHREGDPEFQRFPPHCIEGTPGAEIMPEALATKVLRIANVANAELPADLLPLQQVVLEKQTLDVFDNPNTERVLELLKRFTDEDAEFAVFGVVTEYCVRCAAKGLIERGRHVSIVSDAIQTLNLADGQEAIVELTRLGARLIPTQQALDLVKRSDKSSRSSGAE